MMRTDEERLDPAADRQLWQRCRDADAPEDEAARFLELAAFADGLLDNDERDRVEALLAADPYAAEAVGAAQALRGSAPMPLGIERIVARACEMVPDAAPARGRVAILAPRRRWVQGLAQWGSLAAALVLASWLGFALGTGTSLALSEPRQPSDAGFLPELFDPTTGFLRDLGEGLRT